MTVGLQVPDRGAPLVLLLGADDFRQVHALEAREALGSSDGGLFGDVVAGHDAAVLCAFLPQDAGQAAGVDTGDRHDVVAFR